MSEKQSDRDMERIIDLERELERQKRLLAGCKNSLARTWHELERLREAGDALFEAMPKRASIWGTFREENKRAMGEALERWDELRGGKFSVALSERSGE